MKKKNNFEENMQELMKGLQDFQYKFFVHQYYLENDIKAFIKEIENLEADIQMINGREPSERESKILNVYGQLKILVELFKTKKFMESETDILKIGGLLVRIGTKCAEIGGLK